MTWTRRRGCCARAWSEMVRGGTVGTHPRFVSMLGELIAERVDPTSVPRRRAVGADGPSHDVCPEGCCLPRPWFVNR